MVSNQHKMLLNTHAPSTIKQPLIMEHRHCEYSVSLLERTMFTKCMHSVLVRLAFGELHEKACLRSSCSSHIGHLGSLLKNLGILSPVLQSLFIYLSTGSKFRKI